MSLGGWLVLLLVVSLLGALGWAVARDSIVRVPIGTLGLLLVRGTSTDKALPPGVHWVPALRRRQSVSYPAVELSYRASGDPVVTSPVEAGGPPLRVVLGDRTEAVVSYTVRFVLTPDQLRVVHDRFGTMGYWSAVRDDSGGAVSAALAEPDVTVDSLFPGDRSPLELRLKERVADALRDDGMTVTGFSLGAVDLGRAGETVQATVRARLELAREEAESAIQELRVRHDAALEHHLTGVGDTALRYRQTEVWRDLGHRTGVVRVSVAAPGSAGSEAPQLETPEPEPAGEADGSR